jgi:hypothetical protein
LCICKFNAIADAISRISESPSAELFTGSEEDLNSEVVTMIVVKTVSMPMISKSIVSDLIGAYNVRVIASLPRVVTVMKL